VSDKDYIQIKVRIRRSHEPALAEYFDGIPPQWRAETVRRVLLAALARGMMPRLAMGSLEAPADVVRGPSAAAQMPTAAATQGAAPSAAQALDNEALARMARLNRFD
jgi:hypothetical protein